MRSSSASVLAMLLAVGFILTGSSSAGFGICYTKCFLFCMLKPTQNPLCHCTIHCLEHCILSVTNNDAHEGSDNLGFCKFGCAVSKCSAISSEDNPNGDKVDACVGSCSNKCNNSHSSSPSP